MLLFMALKMSVGEGGAGRRSESLGPWRPERPWPTPDPDIPYTEKSAQIRMLKQILVRLDNIERRLERIEKLMRGRTP